MDDEISAQMRETLANVENFKLPNLEQILELLDGMDGISDEERENLRLSVLEQQSQAGDVLRQRMVANQNASGADYLVFVAMLTLIALVFVLFGYKLYKSLMEKQRKRDEKSKAKKSKKNK